MTKFNLNGFDFQDLFSPTGLAKLDKRFDDYLAEREPHLPTWMKAYRDGQVATDAACSANLIVIAQHLDAFMVQLFSIDSEASALTEKIVTDDPIFVFKQDFVLRRARRLLKRSDDMASYAQLSALLRKRGLLTGDDAQDDELALARHALSLRQDEDANGAELDIIVHWCVRVLQAPIADPIRSSWVSFRLPERLDFENLIGLIGVDGDPYAREQIESQQLRQRDGFGLTDSRMPLRDVMSEVDYCVYCHEKEGDFCSSGFPVKKGQPDLGFKRNPLDELLTGCPLEERISEMHWLKKSGLNIGALAMIMLDNPMCPATGHRICNDCMKACIYQKQSPVNIPQIETRVLTDVLSLPWGVELYDLLTRWNPLRSKQYRMKPYNGKKILVMGMGPAGFTLAHHLLMEGFAVVGADGLKLESASVDPRWLEEPIRDYQLLEDDLADRLMAGFGGVAEYGITVRWDKNFLKLILVSLLRKQKFQVVGSVRFGGTLTVEGAWQMGFDHLALAVGAGLPRELVIPNSLAPGMRQANDFLMALQLTGAAKAGSLANLQVRMPVVVIGGGLTAVDAATEAQAYYLVQIEKMTSRYEALVSAYGESVVRSKLAAEDLAVLDEFIGHAALVRAERERAEACGESPDLVSLLRRFGGVSIVYRRSMQESPAYRANHEELAKALEEGLYYAEGLTPVKVLLDENGHAKGLGCQSRIQDESGDWMLADETCVLPARTILVATGAKPNVAYEFEHRGTFLRQQFEYRRFDRVEAELIENQDKAHVKSPAVGPFTSYDEAGKLVSFLGDTHPVFHGNVVKAIASAARIYPSIVAALAPPRSGGDEIEYDRFRDMITDRFHSYIQSVKPVGDGAVELTVRTPLAAQQFSPGQFYRLQGYEHHAAEIDGTSLHMEAVACVAIRRPDSPDCLSFIVHDNGVSSRLLQRLQPGDRMSVMGPTGTCVKYAAQSTVIMVGAELAAIQLLSIGYAMRAQGVQLVYLSTLTDQSALVCEDELRDLCEDIVFVDSSAVDEALLQYAQTHDVQSVSCIHIIGPGELMKQVQCARHTLLAEVYPSSVKYVAAVYGPMQCMLKGVCAQCLQWQIDPVTGERTKAVYACSWQTQPMEIIDIDNIGSRAGQNRLQEQLSSAWLDHLEKKITPSGALKPGNFSTTPLQ